MKIRFEKWRVLYQGKHGLFTLIEFSRCGPFLTTSYDGAIRQYMIYEMAIWHRNFTIQYRPTPKKTKE